MAVLLYGDTIRDAVLRGDLREMKKLAITAEKQLKAMGDLPASLKILKTEIAKAQRAAKGPAQ